ncbi:hypothetical protein [Sorangium sp. So ce119]|uniref:hypothetical protein n=1 Tax=Sorangium sp. So ce119 TaxID=3133279 RepID=UPI003F5E1D85
MVLLGKKRERSPPQGCKLWESLDTTRAALHERQGVLIDVALPEANGALAAFHRPRARLAETVEKNLVGMMGYRTAAVERRYPGRPWKPLHRAVHRLELNDENVTPPDPLLPQPATGTPEVHPIVEALCHPQDNRRLPADI